MRIQFEEYDRKIFWAIVSIGTFALACYVYFIGVSIFSVIARKEAEAEMGRFTARVTTLESEYMRLLGSIDLDFAHERGFVGIVTPEYISREDVADTLTLNETVGGR